MLIPKLGPSNKKNLNFAPTRECLIGDKKIKGGCLIGDKNIKGKKKRDVKKKWLFPCGTTRCHMLLFVVKPILR